MQGSEIIGQILSLGHSDGFSINRNIMNCTTCVGLCDLAGKFLIMGQRQNTAVKLTMIIKITQYQKSTNGNNAYKRSNPNNSIKIVDALMKTFRLEYVFGPNGNCAKSLVRKKHTR